MFRFIFFLVGDIIKYHIAIVVVIACNVIILGMFPKYKSL